MSDLQELTDELMQDPEFVKEYEAIQPEVNITRAILDARINAGMAQMELSHLQLTLMPIVREDVETVWKMQVEAFSDLLEKYQDHDMSPAAESIDKVLARFEQPWTTYFFIMANNEKVGVVRVVDKKDGSRKRISPIWIMPEYRNKGYAQQAILAAEKKYGSNHWCLDTILQEKGNLHLYEKLGYHQTGRIDRVNDRMDIVYYEKD